MTSIMLANPGRYLLAAPRVDLVEEQTAYLHANRPNGEFVTIAAVHSSQTQRGSVERRLKAALLDHANAQHVIVAVTHETLLRVNPGLLEGWHVGIDEIPDGAVRGGKFDAATTWPFLDRYYKLVPVVGGQWWEVQPRDGIDQPSRGILVRNGHDLLPFHAAACDPRRPLLVDLGAWEDASLPARYVRWFSFWTLTNLSVCASVTIAAASYENSLVRHVHRHLHGDEITFNEVCIQPQAPRASPTVRLHYYCEHMGSTQWWSTTEGERCLVMISKHLESIGFAGYWSCNEKFRLAFQHRFTELWREPRQSGTNALREYTSCGFFYSNKAQAADDATLEILGLDRQTIMEAREYEDLWQFVMRGAIRNSDYAGAYDIYVYSRDQAEALQAKLITNGITDDVTLVPVVEAGLLDIVRPRAARPDGVLPDDLRSLEEHRAATRLKNSERQRRSRAAKRDEKERDGTLRGRGRPRKHPASPAA